MFIKDEPELKEAGDSEEGKPTEASVDRVELVKDKTEAEKMIAAGVHFGHNTNKKHPKMSPYIHGVRNGVSVININKTEEKLEEALKYVEGLIDRNGTIMVVGTKIQLVNLAMSFAKECNLPYIVERWLGGTFTNFDNIKKRVDHLKDLEKKKEEGELEKYTKKEQLDITREIIALKRKFEGLKPLSKLPDAILVLDMDKDSLAVKEAGREGVTIVGITDTNLNPELADFPIPANDDAISSVQYILGRFKERILKANAKKRSA